MAGERDLAAMLAGLSVDRRDGVWVYASVGSLAEAVALEPWGATVAEAEGITAVVTRDVAITHGLSWEFEATWLTLTVHSALEAVGLTQAVATALADRAIPCNVLAGRFHDHLLVPVGRADDAIEAIAELRAAAHG